MKTLISLFCAFLFASCASTPIFTPDKQLPLTGSPTFGTVKDIQMQIVEAAQSLVGRTHLRFGRVSFPADCSGFVLAAYYLAGIDLRTQFSRQTGNGVRRLYQIAAEHELFSSERFPEVGDVLFWDNTFDANGDGKINDELTHVGIVVSASKDGKIEYLHYHVRRGFVLESMNLKHPNSVTLNAPMRIREPGRTRPERWLSSQLYRGKGSLWEMGAAVRRHDGAAFLSQR